MLWNIKRFRIFTSLYDEMYSGHVWVPDFVAGASRQVVAITNLENGRRTWCEVVKLDNYYIDRYNEGCDEKDEKSLKLRVDGHNLVIPQWYRAKLGIEDSSVTGFPKSTSLKISASCWCVWRLLFACLSHPQNVVRLATWLAIYSMILGSVSLLPCVGVKVVAAVFMIICCLVLRGITR